jgi:hypothetical protein
MNSGVRFAELEGFGGVLLGVCVVELIVLLVGSAVGEEWEFPGECSL